jgi:hypothetical protein
MRLTVVRIGKSELNEGIQDMSAVENQKLLILRVQRRLNAAWYTESPDLVAGLL